MKMTLKEKIESAAKSYERLCFGQYERYQETGDVRQALKAISSCGAAAAFASELDQPQLVMLTSGRYHSLIDDFTKVLGGD